MCAVLIAGVLVALAAAYFFWPPGDRYDPSEYQRLRGMMPPKLAAGLPTAIPPGVTGVRLRAFGPREGLLPAPDWNMELRYVTTPADAAQVEAGAIVTDAALKDSVNFSWRGVENGLSTADDQNSATPLPAGFKSYLLANPSETNMTGVSVNAATGEVIYWIFES